MESAAYWDEIFATKPEGEASWFQRDPGISLRLLREWSSPSCSLIDVGAGTSTLVDHLLEAGWSDLTILDVSAVALQSTRERLGERSDAVAFVCADVGNWRPDRTFDVWHDRAVFHFLTDPAARDHYVASATDALGPSGLLVLATFAADGPDQCSGLPTVGYDADGLADLFASGFDLVHAERELHSAPSGSEQAFTWVVLRRA